MKNNYNIMIGCLIIAIGIVIHGYMLKYDDNQMTESITDLKGIFDITEAAEYLHMTNQKVKDIITTESKSLSRTGSFTGEMLPYFKVDDEYYFYKEGLDRWVEDVATDRGEYDTIKQLIIR